MSKTALITGATSGIGEAAARAFAAAGWRVIATGRRAERLKALVDAIGADKVHPAAFDVADEAARDAALAALPNGFRGIDLLINNAGLALGRNPAQAADLAQWKTMIDTNVTALASLTHKLLPGLIARRGAIINLSSVAANYPYAGGNVYAGTKAFVKEFSLGLRSDLHGTGVRVTSIEPGMVETEFTLVRTRRRSGGVGDALSRREADDRRGHRGDNVVGGRAAAAPQHQPAGADAREPIVRRVPGRPRHLGASRKRGQTWARSSTENGERATSRTTRAGHFVRPDSPFRNWITASGEAGTERRRRLQGGARPLSPHHLARLPVGASHPYLPPA